MYPFQIRTFNPSCHIYTGAVGSEKGEPRKERIIFFLLFQHITNIQISYKHGVMKEEDSL